MTIINRRTIIIETPDSCMGPIKITSTIEQFGREGAGKKVNESVKVAEIDTMNHITAIQDIAKNRVDWKDP